MMTASLEEVERPEQAFIRTGPNSNLQLNINKLDSERTNRVSHQMLGRSNVRVPTFSLLTSEGSRQSSWHYLFRLGFPPQKSPFFAKWNS